MRDASNMTNAVKSNAPAAATQPPFKKKDRDFEADRTRLARARKKRLAVAVEALASEASIEVVPKDEDTVRLIARAVRDNPLFEGLPDETRAVLISSMTRVEIDSGADIITQHDPHATKFYVLEQGAAVVRVKPKQEDEKKTDSDDENALADYAATEEDVDTKSGPVVATIRSGDAFGELALLYSCPRAATVRATFDCSLWALDRDVFICVRRAFELAQRAKKKNLVDNVPALGLLTQEQRSGVADALKPVTFDKGISVVVKHQPGDRFFVVSSGKLEVLDPDSKTDPDKPLAFLSQGDAFGERALMSQDDVREATVTVTSDHCELYYLERAEFNTLLGSYSHVKKFLAFRNVPALNSVSDEDLHLLAKGVVEERFGNDEIVCALGTAADAMFVMESGVVTVESITPASTSSKLKSDPNALETESNESIGVPKRPGEWFGERALMGASTTRAIQATSVGETVIYVLRRAVLELTLGVGLEKIERRARLERVADVALFQGLDDSTKAALADALQPVAVEPNGVVFEQNSKGSEMFFIESGNVALCKVTGTHKTVLKTATRGEHFGELALLRGDPRAARAEATETGAFLLALSRDVFHKTGGATARAALEKAALEAYGGRANSLNGDSQNSITTTFGSYTQLTDFNLKAVLGVGAFGKVYLATHDTSKMTCAIKSLSKRQLLNARLHKHVVQERDVMRDVASSKHTVCLLGTFQDATRLYVATEVVMGGELFNRLARVGGAISESDAQFYTACVTLGLQYMQKKHYVYRDLKPENLLVARDGYVKIADFGFAKRLKPGDKTYTLCGTPEYMAPELFKQSGHDRGVDWWALGILAYEMVLGSPPFYSPDGDGSAQVRRVLSGKFVFPKGQHRASAEFEDFVKKCLHPTSSKRLGCGKDGASDVKKHVWVKGVDWKGIEQGTTNSPWLPPVGASDDDTSCFDEYDLHCEHPGAAFETGKKGQIREGDVFKGF